MPIEIIINGFKTDIAKAVSLLDLGGCTVYPATEETLDEVLPKYPQLIVFVFSKDTGYSSQLHGAFGHTAFLFPNVSKYILPIELINCELDIFHTIKNNPIVTSLELNEILKVSIASSSSS